jgi:rhamnogalacturonan endolyase
MNNKLVFYLFIFLLSGCTPKQKPAGYEKIDRGVVALSIDETHAYVGWRLLKDDPEDVAFNVYRRQVGLADFVKVTSKPVNRSTNFVDSTVNIGQAYRYRIKIQVGSKDVETPGEGSVYMAGKAEFDTTGASARLLNKPYYSLRLKDNITLNRVGIGDLDKDGAYDFVIQSPNYNTDPYYRLGYWKPSLETYKLDAYNSKGKFLWRYDMGWAIEAGTWYAPYMVYDIDGDGVAEIYTKAGDGDTREMDGHVLEGSEYLVKLDGQTGKIVQKTDWISKEGFENYNYWSRNFLTVGYFNGINPSLVMQRGTYTIIKIAALNKKLEREWYFESSGENKKYRGQGGHAIHGADIDLDGKDELVPGTFALDNDGKPMWYTGLGHDDVGYVADVNPSRPGMEIFYGIETRSPKNGVCLVDAATGQIIWGYEGKTTHVHFGRIGDIIAEYPGMESYAGEAKGGAQSFMYTADGKRLSEDMGSQAPLNMWWDADDLKELNIGKNITKYKGDTLLTIEGRVMMIADIIGDWREEIVTSLPGELRIYSTNIPAGNRKVCLLQNRQYRSGVANTTSGYFYTPQLGIEPKK